MPDNKFDARKHIDNLSWLRSVILNFLSGVYNEEEKYYILLASALQNSCRENGYFTEFSIRYALHAIAGLLEEKNLKAWVDSYGIQEMPEKNTKTIGVVIAGNIPLVGFHDFLCVLISGNKFLGKLSKQDRYLLPALAEILMDIDSHYKDSISFTVDKIQGFDAVIATGSNNTARYFEYYFGKYPNIIRKNRNSIAILNGNETEQELRLLADDMFLYFGLGCRNISKLFVPENYNFRGLIEACLAFADYINHNNFRNNYDYYKTIYLMNNMAFIDCGFYILHESPLLHNPVAAFNFEFYSSLDFVNSFINQNFENLQCIVSNLPEIKNAIPFGEAQTPQLIDYADNIDTMKFLLAL